MFADHKVQVFFNSDNTIGQFFRKPKDRSPKMNQCGVMYNIPCGTCTKSYMCIGHTGRPLSLRCKEHRKQGTSGNNSAGHDHSESENATIIDKEDRELV